MTLAEVVLTNQRPVSWTFGRVGGPVGRPFAVQLALVFLQILLGGIFLPREQLPDVLETIGDWLPLSHAFDGLTAVATGDQDSSYIWLRVLSIGCWILGAIIVGSLTLRRQTP